MPDERIAAADVVIVGAGVIGLSLAYELLRRARSVAVLERDRPGAGASSVAAGMLAPTSEADLEEPVLLALALDSLGRYPAFVRELEALSDIPCHLRTEGTLWVALDRDDDAELDHLRAMQKAKGMSSQRLTAAEVHEKEPRLSGRVIGGLWVEQDYSLDPRALVASLVEAVTRHGGRLHAGCAVEDIEPVAGGVRITGTGPEAAAFELTAPAVVLAAGSWSTAGVRSPVADLGVRPVKGQIVRLRGEPLLNHNIRHPRIYLVPRLDGELIVGATMEEQGFDASPTAGATLDLLRRAWEVLPGIDDLAITELSVGFRPALRDHLPIIGPSGVDGLYLAIGHFRNGILLAPATAQELADLIVTGERRPVLTPFQVERLRGHAPDLVRGGVA